MGKLYVVGIGPGTVENMTLRAVKAIEKSEVIVGYKTYIEMVDELIENKQVFSTGMKGEIERCKKAIEISRHNNVSIISTGDAGIYGMAGLIFQLSENVDWKVNIEIIPGVTASTAAASLVGAPLMHDNCNISLSDLMTPYELIKKRVEFAAKGDFVISLYNPRSKGRPYYLKECMNIIGTFRTGKTPVAIVKNALRSNEKIILTNIKDFSDEDVDMMSIVIVGNSRSYIQNNNFITPRGYERKILTRGRFYE